MSLIESILAALVPGMVMAVVTAYVSVRLALRRHRAEKWWERKAKAYEEIIGALHRIKQPIDQAIREHLEEEEIGEAEQDWLEQQRTLGLRELRRQGDIGSLVISREAIDALMELDKEWADLRSLPEYHSISYGAATEQELIEDALERIKTIARRDLEIGA